MNSFHTKVKIIFFIGMAGSGKTSLIQRISLDFSFLKKNHYIINIDPASYNIPYSPNMDIRDTIDYKKIMKEYGLGPNGAILTSLNLFATRFDQVKKIIDKNSNSVEYLVIDTPGQIEIFTWSASGSIMCETFSSSYPVTLLFIVDIVRTTYPLTFVSNILYSCSVLYRVRVPLLITLNKVDLISTDFLREWLNDSDMFDRALEKENFFAGSFARSLALTLENFYQKVPFVNISSLTGIGIFQLLNFLKKSSIEFIISFQQELEKNIFKHISNYNYKIIKNQKIYLSKNTDSKIAESDFDNNIINEEFDYLDIIEFIVTLKIENDKIYLHQLF